MCRDGLFIKLLLCGTSDYHVSVSEQRLTLCVSNKDSGPTAVTSSLSECPGGIMPFSGAVFQWLALCDWWARTCSSYYIFPKSEYSYCINCVLQMFVKNPDQTLFTLSNHEGSLHIYILYIICMACLNYFQKENIVFNELIGWHQLSFHWSLDFLKW